MIYGITGLLFLVEYVYNDGYITTDSLNLEHYRMKGRLKIYSLAWVLFTETIS